MKTVKLPTDPVCRLDNELSSWRSYPTTRLAYCLGQNHLAWIVLKKKEIYGDLHDLLRFNQPF